MMILGFLFLLLAVWYWIRNRDRKGGKISALLLAVVGVTIIGFTHADNVDKQRAAESSSIASSKKAKSESISESKSESRDQAMDDATYTALAKNLTSQMASDSTLNGFKIAYKDSQFYVTVPTEVAVMTDNEQKEVYSSVISLLESHNANAPVSFYDQNGNAVARMTLSGGVKLYK
ncbi:hypothetical protein RF673_07820 [Limosilactobacillus fermentum]|uniref:hypothetical protein n=1 Tax=Limosilactobacillus fermentum TaxID=1613 RepID=UPI00285FB892|nr:hypothetical protein [Limosilactobacillus fermentum]MDR7663574.1 hypothetical protein [Limosilactobacillus fermentum]MDR7663626.1 hypothetical protein [Limosilactobacillus fermentum]